MEGGVYTLVVRVNEPSKIPIGGLGPVPFERGYYLYTGSAVRGLAWRLKRHLSQDKKLRWHIDYLLSPDNVEVSAVVHAPTRRRLECQLNQRLGEMLPVRMRVGRFGSSDCRSGCGSHLLFLGDRSLTEILEGVREGYISLDLKPLKYRKTKPEEGWRSTGCSAFPNSSRTSPART